MSAKGGGVTGNPRTGAPAQPVTKTETQGSGGCLTGNPRNPTAQPSSGGNNSGPPWSQPMTAPAPPEKTAKQHENG